MKVGDKIIFKKKKWRNFTYGKTYIIKKVWDKNGYIWVIDDSCFTCWINKKHFINLRKNRKKKLEKINDYKEF